MVDSEVRGDVRSACGAVARATRRILHQRHDGSGQRLRVGDWHQQAGFAIDDRFGNAAGARADDGESHGHGVEHGRPQPFRD